MIFKKILLSVLFIDAITKKNMRNLKFIHIIVSKISKAKMNTLQNTTPSLASFMHGLIDYAGLFPPAKLNLHDTLKNMLRGQKFTESWMISSLVLPVNQLDNLIVTLIDLGEADAFFPISFVASRAESEKDFFDTLNTDIKRIKEFFELHPSFSVKAFEIALPTSICHSGNTGDLSLFVKDTASILIEAKLNPFIEVAAGENWISAMHTTVSAISELNEGSSDKASFKIRCGGIKPQMMPPSENIAHTILYCKEKNISLKATAGLHHPIKHFNDELGGIMHGFINVFGSAILTKVNDISFETLVKMLNDESENSFIFSGNTLSWKNFSVNSEEIKNYRSFITSYGSCSFDEPIEDLQTLKLLK